MNKKLSLVLLVCGLMFSGEAVSSGSCFRRCASKMPRTVVKVAGGTCAIVSIAADLGILTSYIRSTSWSTAEVVTACGLSVAGMVAALVFYKIEHEYELGGEVEQLLPTTQIIPIPPVLGKLVT